MSKETWDILDKEGNVIGSMSVDKVRQHAPALYEALKDALGYMEGRFDNPIDKRLMAVAKARAALALVDGK